MATPPIFLASYVPSGGVTTGTSRNASVTAAIGDTLVCWAEVSDSGATLTAPTGGTGLTWTLRTSITGFGSFSNTYIWTAPVTATLTAATISVACSSNLFSWYFEIAKFSGVASIGAATSTHVSGAAPTLNITTTVANSVVLVANADWNAVSGASRTWRTGAGTLTELFYFNRTSPTTLTAYAGYHADAGAAGVKAVGLSAPSGQKYSISAVELVGNTGPITIPGGNRVGSSTPSGALTGGKTTVKGSIVGSTAPGATIAAKTSVKAAQTGSTTPTGLALKAVTKVARVGSTTPSGTVTPTRVILLATRTGSITGSSVIKPFSTVKNSVKGSSTPTGLLQRNVTKTNRTGSITPTGSAPPAHIFNRPKAGSTAPSGSILGKMPIKFTRAGSVTPFGVIGPKEITYRLTSSTAPFGTVVPHRLSATAMWLGPAKALPDFPIIWSTIAWEETYLPPGASIVVQTSVNNGATWEDAVNGGPIPHLEPGTNVVKAIMYRVLLTRANGVSPKPIVDKLYIDVDTTKSHDELVPCGSFLITDTVITDTPEGVVIELDGMDLSLRVRENAWEGVKTFPAGTNMGDVIQQVILDRDPDAKFGSWASTQMVAPATLTFGASASNDPLADVQKCATFCGNELFMDYQGYYVFQPQPDPTTDPVVRVFSDRSEPVMTKVMRRLTRTESYNYIVVSGEASGNDASGNPIVPVSASVADNDPLSPTYYLGNGGKRVKRFVSKLVLSVADALTMAQGLLLKLKGAGETVEISCVPDPSMTEGDTVGVDRSTAGLNANYLVDAFQIDFTDDQDMTWAGRRQKLDQSQASGGGVGGLDGDTGSGSGGSVPRTYTTPGECHKIGTNGNLNHFKLQTAFTGGSAIVEKSQAQIGGGYAQSPEYCMTADRTAVQMKVNLNAPTTSGSTNPRTEYRQVGTDGSSETGFVPANGYGFQQTFRFTHLPAVAQSCSGMQIHDASDDVLQIKTALVSGVLKIGYSKNGGSFVAIDNYTLGAWVTVRIIYTSATALSIIYKAGKDYSLAGATTTNLTGMTHSGNCYFKGGTYPQGTSGESSSDYATGEYTRLGSYYPGGPPPVYDTDTIGGGGSASSFTLAFSACINANASSAGSLTHIKNAGPDYFAILGDFWYKDGATPDWVADWTRQTGYSNFAALINALPNPMIVGVSDHDFGYENNSTGVGKGSTFVNNFNAAYRTKWGSSGPNVQNQTLPSVGIYRTWVVGRVRFVLLDMLSFKSALSSTDNSSKTMLGSTQKAWYKNILSTASEPLIVVLGDGQIPGPAEAAQDEWRGYNTERNELASAVTASPRTVIYLNGDTHSLAAGSNQYGYDRVWQAAPLHNTTKVKAAGAGYTQQYPDNANESDTVFSELYGIVTFTDSGSSISVTFKGYEATDVRITDTLTVVG